MTACGGGGGGGGSNPVASVNVGGAASKGPIVAGNVSVHRLNADGSRDATALVSGVTQADSSFLVEVNPSAADYVVLVLTDGSYIDEATGNTITLSAGEQLEAYAALPASGQITVNITPLTTLAAAQAREHMANDGQSLSQAIANAAAEISAVFDIGDVTGTNLPALTDLGSATQQEINYVLLLAGLSQLDNDNLTSSAFEILSEMVSDLEADGVWGDATANTPTLLRAAINQFLADNAGTISETLSSKLDATLSKSLIDIQVESVNIIPVAADDSASVDEGAAVNIDLAANDTDAEGALDLTSITIVSAPANGAVVVNTDGSVDYTHDGGETTSDSFTYTIADSGTPSATSNTATVSVTVTPQNDVPVANDDAATISEGATANINLAGNDNDAEGALDLASIVIVGAPSNGSLVVNANGSVDYTHDGSETTSDVFTYTIADASAAVSNTATVNVTVSLLNDPPSAQNDVGSVDEGGTVNIDLAANDNDPEGMLNLTSINIVSGPSNGSVVINADGSVDYTHDGGETTGDSFTYNIADAAAVVSNTATVSVVINPVNDTPVANDDSSTLNEGASASIDLAGNDVDAEGALDLTSISIISSPTNGSLVVNADGTVDYTHDGSETVSDSFTYTIDDASAVTSNTATVSVTVTPQNDLPVAGDDSGTVSQGDSINIDLAANDSDAEGALDLTSISIVSAPASGSLVVNADGTVDYTHGGSATTSDSFTYTIDDTGTATSNTATVSVTVLLGFNEALYSAPAVSSSSSPARVTQASDGLTGDPTNGWVVSGADPGPHTLTLNFDSPKSIYRVTLSDLVDLTNQVTSATIDFSNGDSINVSSPLPDDGTATEFIFAPKLVDSITVTLNTAKAGGTFGLSEFSAYSTLDPGQSVVTSELFNDGDAAGWTVVDDCVKGTSSWSAATNEYIQTGDCRGFSSNEGVELGTYPVMDAFTVKDMDLRVRFKSTDTSGSGGTWVNGAIGVLFAYRTNDYYRLDLSQAEGHTKLWKKVGDGMGGGDFTELSTSPQSYVSDTWFNLRIVRQNGVIVVFLNDDKIMAVEDNENSLNNNPYQIALLCGRNESCSFDNLMVLTTPADPIVGVSVDDDGFLAAHMSGEYYVDTSGILELEAVTTDTGAITGIEFEVDGDAGSAVIDSTAPYTATFNALAAGNHTVRAYLRDGSGRIADADAVDELPGVGVSGLNLVGLGDSITGGLFDDNSADDTSTDGRNTSGGYQPVLNNLLTTANSQEVTVLNEGNAGELSSEGAARIDAVLARTPGAQGYLAIYGANDSSGGSPTPSGSGLTCTDLLAFTGCDAGYLGSFKHNMQQIINAVTAAGKAIYLGKAPPHVSNATRDTLIQGYNTVIDELITDNGLTYTAPDFHTYFTNNPGEMADDLHPNGTGYQSMANLWCTSLNGQAGMVCP